MLITELRTQIFSKMEQKLKELATKYKIPLELLKQAIEKERKKVVLQNRRMTPELIKLIEQHTDS